MLQEAIIQPDSVNPFLVFLPFGGLFLNYPYLAFIPAVVFGLTYYSIRKKLILTTAVIWGLYALTETYHWYFTICVEPNCGGSVRLELLLIYPILIILTIATLISVFLSLTRDKKSSTQE